MSADNPIFRNPVGPPTTAARSNRGQPDRLTNAIMQKYGAAPLQDVLSGGVGPSQIIEQGIVAGGPAAYSLVGAVTLSLTPAAEMLEGRGIVGAVTLTLTPAAQMLEGRVLTGAVTLRLTPGATMVFSGTAPSPTVVVVGGRPRHHPGRRKRKRVEAEVQALEVQALAAQITAELTPAPWELDDETVLDLLLLEVL